MGTHQSPIMHKRDLPMTRCAGRIWFLFMAAGLLASNRIATAQPGQSAAGVPAQAGVAKSIGDRVPNTNSLRDVRGNRQSLHDFKNHKAIVLVFLGTDCPVSNLYVPALIEM